VFLMQDAKHLAPRDLERHADGNGRGEAVRSVSARPLTPRQKVPGASIVTVASLPLWETTVSFAWPFWR